MIPTTTDVILRPDSSRVLVRSFIPADRPGLLRVIERALAVDEEEIEGRLAVLLEQFGSRHPDLQSAWRRHYAHVRPHLPYEASLSDARRLYLGALFSGEYALESAALFNPSIVPHPDQAGIEPGALRFILSLRATGEGHISSIEFRIGMIHADGSVTVESPPRHVVAPDLDPDPVFKRSIFLRKLREIELRNPFAEWLADALDETFTRRQLEDALADPGGVSRPAPKASRRILECIRWLTEVNYEVRFDPALSLAERVIFPVSPTESNGMEDARFVRFSDELGETTYYATYTAYNGRSTVPQLLETRDFTRFRAGALNGRGVRNKGMALFPRKINGRYVMISRQDDENLYLMVSEDIHSWEDASLLRRPREAWEAIKIGNCGSPIETPAGWLVITHGVGAMRRYCIGAILLDLDDPSQVLGHLAEPLVQPPEPQRDGYVPNVVYTCGALVHGGRLILPYGLNDTITTIATFDLAELLALLDPRQG